MKRIVIVATLFALAAGLGVAWHLWGPGITPAGQAPLQIIEGRSLEEFRAEFNAHADSLRILLLLSPT